MLHYFYLLYFLFYIFFVHTFNQILPQPFLFVIQISIFCYFLSIFIHNNNSIFVQNPHSLNFLFQFSTPFFFSLFYLTISGLYTHYHYLPAFWRLSPTTFHLFSWMCTYREDYHRRKWTGWLESKSCLLCHLRWCSRGKEWIHLFPHSYG